MATEAGLAIQDLVTAELVDCTPAVDVPSVSLPDAPAETPIQHALHATIEQTGSGPPPDGAT